MVRGVALANANVNASASGELEYECAQFEEFYRGCSTCMTRELMSDKELDEMENKEVGNDAGAW